MEGRYGESLDLCSLKETLKCINHDVLHCLDWLDLVLVPSDHGCSLAFVGLESNPNAEVSLSKPHDNFSSSHPLLVVHATCDIKGNSFSVASRYLGLCLDE